DQDQEDMDRGVALHQKGLNSAVIDKQWRWATDDEMKPVLEATGWNGEHKAEPTTEELQTWAALGTLPPGQGGHPKTSRGLQEWSVPNVSRDVSKLEHQMLENVKRWTPCFDWIPRPLATGEKFFLILYSGHRRCGDIASWFQWDGRVRPIAIDVAVDKEAGDIMNCDLWIRLIKSRRVVGGHAGPPCETYTSARWNQLEGEVCPRPLRDSDQPWGRDFLTLREGLQVNVGTALMLMALRLLVTIFIFGGSISLEHPKGNQEDTRQWCIWQSAFMRWLLLDAQIQTVTFLQGPLGQKFAKPTTMMVGRLANFAHRIFATYNKKWALAPLFHVVPAYAVLVVKGDANCAAPRALDGNFYSFELARDFEPFVQAVERSLLRSPEGRARDNAAAFWDFLRYPSDAVASGADIFRYLAPLEDMLDLTDGIGPCAAPRKGRVVSIPTEKRVEHVFTNCQPLERDSCTEQEREFIDAADLQRESQVELELLRMSQLLDMSQSTTEPRNAELLDRMVILKRLKRENSWRFGRTSSKQRSATPRRQLRHAKRGCSAATLGGRWTDPLVVSGCVDLEHGKGGSDLFPRPTYRRT
ncbi:unnamed protein product, partial [Cladocopium goreaui]